MSKRAALYIRVSSDEQARHGLSLGEQRADLLNYAKEHGYIVAGIYADEGVTARKALSRRKELQRLLSDVEKGLIDIIIIKCLDRWFRNVADFYKVKEKLDAYGVDWECTREEYNTTTPNGILMLNLKLSIAQNESDQTGERIKYVLAGKKERREVLGGSLPLGYKVENKKPVIDEEKAKAIRAMFEHVANGGSIRSCITLLYQKFNIIRSRRVVGLCLQNRGYIGELYGIPDYTEAIIPHDLFFKVQEIMKNNSKNNKKERIYLFNSLLRCPLCGGKMAAEKGQMNVHGEYKSFQYRCRHRSPKGSAGCQFTRSVMEKKVESFLLTNLQALIKEHIIYIEKQRVEKAKDNPEKRIDTLKAKLSRLEDIYIEGAMSKEKYLKSYKEISGEISDLTLALDTPLSVPVGLREIVNDKDFVNTYNNLTRENKHKFWRSIISRIEWKDTPNTRGKGAYIPFKVIFL